MKIFLKKRFILPIVIFMSIMSFFMTTYAVNSSSASNQNYTLFGVGYCAGISNNVYHTWVSSSLNGYTSVSQLYYSVSTYRNFTKISGKSKTNYNARYCEDDIYTAVSSNFWAYYEVYSYHSSTDASLGNLVTTCSDSQWN